MDERTEKPDPAGPKAFARKAWMEALQELESTPVATHKPAAVPAAAPAPLEPALESIRSAQAGVEAFVKAHPYLVAPNIFNLWLDNLKETRLILERQLQRPAGGGE